MIFNFEDSRSYNIESNLNYKSFTMDYDIPNYTGDKGQIGTFDGNWLVGGNHIYNGTTERYDFIKTGLFYNVNTKELYTEEKYNFYKQSGNENLYSYLQKNNLCTIQLEGNDYFTSGETDDTPAKINTRTVFTKISAGTNHAIALDNNGKLWTWGDNTYNQGCANKNKGNNIYVDNYEIGNYVENPTSITCAETQLLPTKVNTTLTYTEISAGNGYNLAKTSNGRVYSWGKNEYGECGNGSNVTSELRSIGNITGNKIFAGNGYSMIISDDSKLFAFGNNIYGQLGVGVNNDKVLTSSGAEIRTKDDIINNNPGTFKQDESQGTCYWTNSPSSNTPYDNYYYFYDTATEIYYRCKSADNPASYPKYYIKSPLQITDPQFGTYKIRYIVDNYINNNNTYGWIKEEVSDFTRAGRIVVAPIKQYDGFTFNPSTSIIYGEVSDQELILEVHYLANEYDIIYDLDGGNFVGSTPLNKNRYISNDYPDNLMNKLNAYIFKPEDLNAQKSGYTLTDWLVKVGNGDYESINLSTNIGRPYGREMGVLSVKTVWAPSDVTYTIETYMQNTTLTGYDKTTETLNGKYGEVATVIPQNIEGFTFDQSKSVLEKTLESSDNILKVYYTRNTYNISLDSNGGTINNGNVISYIYGVGATLPTNVTKAGYSFGGWYAPKGTEPILSISTSDIGEKSFIAKWIPNNNTQYQIVHQKEKTVLGEYDIVETENRSGTTDSAVSATPRTYEGYVEDPNNVHAANIKGDGSLVITLKYNRIRYPVTLDTEGGRITEGKNITEYAHGVGVALPTENDVVRGGYNFLGWHNASGTRIERIESNETGPKSYTAWWEARTDTKYYIEYYFEDSNLTTYSIDNTKTEEKQGTTGTKVKATDREYEGYYKAKDNSLSVMEGIISGEEPLVLKLYFKKIRYQVNLDSNGGTILEGKNITEYAHGVGAVLPTENDITRPGYDFTGWHNPDNMSGNAITQIASTETGEKSFKAGWNVRTDTEYKIEYYFENTDLTTYSKDDTKTENKTGTTEQTVTAEIKEFEGFIFDEGNTNNVVSASIAGNGSTTLKFYYKRIRYPVILDARGGTFAEGKNITEYAHGVGTILPTSEEVTKPGYGFMGWYDLNDLDGQPKDRIESTSIGERKFRARWAQGVNTKYTVECYGEKVSLDGYELIKTENRYGITDEEVIIETPIEIENFIYDSNNSQNVLSGIVKGDESLVLKIYYNRARYSVTLNPNGGTIRSGNITEYIYGEEKILPTDVKKTGSTFMGWYDETKEIPERVYTINANTSGNIVLVAHWDDTIQTDEYEVIEKDGNRYIIGVNPIIRVDEFLDKIYTEGTTEMRDGVTGTVMQLNDIVKTGDKLIVEKDGKTYEYTIIVVGDVNRDGKFDTIDLTWLIKYKIGKMDLSTESKMAGDMNLDQINNIVDISIMCKKLVGTM